MSKQKGGREAKGQNKAENQAVCVVGGISQNLLYSLLEEGLKNSETDQNTKIWERQVKYLWWHDDDDNDINTDTNAAR